MILVHQAHSSRGTAHNYLRLTIDFSEKNQVVFIMYDYIEDIIVDTDPANMTGIANNPAQPRLSAVDESSPLLLNEIGADFVHSMTARLLFAAKRAHPDIQVDIAYLYTRVKAPTVNDYEKLSRVIRYICCTVHLPLVIG